MQSLSFTIPGPPQGKARPVVTKHGAFTPKKTVAYENLVKMAFVEKYPAHVPLEGAVRVHIYASFQPPKSASKKKLRQMLAHLIKPLVKPDLDNIAKGVCDALNGIAWNDDKQITDLYVGKRYDENPRVEVDILSTE